MLSNPPIADNNGDVFLNDKLITDYCLWIVLNALRSMSTCVTCVTALWKHE